MYFSRRSTICHGAHEYKNEGRFEGNYPAAGDEILTLRPQLAVVDARSVIITICKYLLKESRFLVLGRRSGGKNGPGGDKR